MVAIPLTADVAGTNFGDHSTTGMRQFQTFTVAVCTSEECPHVLSLVERGRLNGNANEFKQ
jgi:hypothetical protein